MAKYLKMVGFRLLIVDIQYIEYGQPDVRIRIAGVLCRIACRAPVVLGKCSIHSLALLLGGLLRGGPQGL